MNRVYLHIYFLAAATAETPKRIMVNVKRCRRIGESFHRFYSEIIVDAVDEFTRTPSMLRISSSSSSSRHHLKNVRYSHREVEM